MADKSGIEEGSEIRIKREADGWAVTIAHAGDGFSGKLAKLYQTLDEVLADLRATYGVR